ncbi:MAG TPA: NAD(P)-binding protein [Acidimicrobiales bacterium]|nr:NAD(P)-binding protein [Acidimicrobiales bacterium]
MTEAITADYLIMGAGAAGMAFADTVLTETDATIVMVDRHDRPGGHWNDAYPFVRLHQPSAFYGLGSAPLGTGRIERVGLNAGLSELAAGHEVLGHFDLAMRERFLPSGRVHFFPMSEVGDDRVITSLLSDERCTVDVRRFVDATYSQMHVPSTTPRPYAVADGVGCVPLNALPRVAPDHDRFVVIGAGKTGMDACIWLLENGVDPDRITWIMPRDSWVLNRANLQPGDEFFAAFSKSLADQVEAVALADSVDDVFARLEASGELRRIDPTVQPEAYHCATLSDGELEALRRIGDVVRMGHVRAIDRAEIRLELGTIETTTTTLHVDCSATGLPVRPATPVFAADRITIQMVRACQPTFSAAFIGFVESAFTDEDEKNRICTPIPAPDVPLDWLKMMRQELVNRDCWVHYPQIQDWMVESRLDPINKSIRYRLGENAEAAAHLGRYLTHFQQAQAKLDELLAD